MFFFISQLHVFAQQCPSTDIVSYHQISGDSLDEISGVSFQSDNVIWVHNDSGDKSILYRLNRNGDIEQNLQVPEINARDWEDMAIIKKEKTTTLYIADIGDNKERHSNYPIHIVSIKKDSEQQDDSYKIESTKTIFVDYGTLGPRDAEGLAVDPKNEDIYILTKGRGGTAYLLRKKSPHEHKEQDSMEVLHQFEIPVISGLNAYRFTALDIAKDGNAIVWRDYQSAFLIRKKEQESWDDVFLPNNVIEHQICPLSLPIQPQGESIAFGTDSSILLTTSEKKNQPLYVLELRDIPIRDKKNEAEQEVVK